MPPKKKRRAAAAAAAGGGGGGASASGPVAEADAPGAQAAAAAAPVPAAPAGLAPKALGDWWKKQIDKAAVRHRAEQRALTAAHKAETAALTAAKKAAMAAACPETMTPCTMCKSAIGKVKNYSEDSDDGCDGCKCSECELPYCQECIDGGIESFPQQCIDCVEEGVFNCCRGIMVTHCHGGMVCEDCVPKHKSGGNRGKRKGFTPDGCACLLDDDDTSI